MSILLGRYAARMARRSPVAIGGGMFSSHGFHSSPGVRVSKWTAPQPHAHRTMLDVQQVGEQMKAERVQEALKFLFPLRVADGSLSIDWVLRSSTHTGPRETFALETWDLVVKNDHNPRYLREACVLFYWRPMESTLSNATVSQLNFHGDKLINAIQNMHVVLDTESALRALLYVVSLIVNVSRLDTELRLDIVAACCRSLVTVLEQRRLRLGFWEANRLSRLIITSRLYHEPLLECYSRCCLASVRSNARYYTMEFAEKWFYPLVLMSYPAAAAMASFQQCTDSARLGGYELLRLCWCYVASGVAPPPPAIHALHEHCPMTVISPEYSPLVRPLQPYLPPDSLCIEQALQVPTGRAQFFNEIHAELPEAWCRVEFPHGDWIDVAALYNEASGEFVPFPTPFRALQITRAETESFSGRPVALLIVPAGHVMRGDECVSGVVAYQRRQLQRAGWRVATLDQRLLDERAFKSKAIFAVDYLKIHCAG